MLTDSTKPEGVLPAEPRHVHLLGICGVGMAGLAGLFIERGVTVTGSDKTVYPPMSEHLLRLGIEIQEGYSPLNLSPLPDLVIIGNVIKRDNQEAMAAINLGVPYTSMPGAIEKYFLQGKLCFVVIGTHGKTTVSSMISWILHDHGLNPGFMIGGLPNNFSSNSRLGGGTFFVIEGDEYDSAYFDKQPKFLHYNPFVGVVTSCEFDHADIYKDLAAIQLEFQRFLKLIPRDGGIIACNDYSSVNEILEQNDFQFITYGLNEQSHWRVSKVIDACTSINVEFAKDSNPVASGALPVLGCHNAVNALAAIAAVEKVGISAQSALDSLASFRGVARRQQVSVFNRGFVLIDDFAHHPSEVLETLNGVRFRFPHRRLIAVFEPRTNTSRRSIFQDKYLDSFMPADIVLLRDPSDPWKAPKGDLFSSSQLAHELKSFGKDAWAFPEANSIIDFLMSCLKPGDVITVMSNGNFENLVCRLKKRLEDFEK
ncbi:MAG: UDP-N-acetylmuramate--L-alanine ligase [Desulfomonilaceae bacterium]